MEFYGYESNKSTSTNTSTSPWKSEIMRSVVGFAIRDIQIRQRFSDYKQRIGEMNTLAYKINFSQIKRCFDLILISIVINS